jgi:hypothetical protein
MMKAWIAILLLAFAGFAQADYREFVLEASSAKTVTGNGSTVDALPTQIAWNTADGRVLVDVTTVSGTTPTLTVNLQCMVGAVAWTLGSTASITVAGQHTFVATDLCQNVRAQWVIGGGTPSFTFSVRLVRN